MGGLKDGFIGLEKASGEFFRVPKMLSSSERNMIRIRCWWNSLNVVAEVTSGTGSKPDGAGRAPRFRAEPTALFENVSIQRFQTVWLCRFLEFLKVWVSN